MTEANRTPETLTVTVSDGTGYLELVWWNQQFRTRAFTVGKTFAIAGRVETNRMRGKTPAIINPFVEAVVGVERGQEPP